MTEAPIPPGEMTLDELRAALAPLIPAHAAFDGWSDEALAMAAAELRVPSERARLCFPGGAVEMIDAWFRSEEHTSELQSLMRISYAAFCLKKKNTRPHTKYPHNTKS